jgi:S-adenosylmethionine/arginine decarboxylase-like enzyme
MSQWGWHLILDCGGCNDNIKSKHLVAAFAKQIVADIDMKAFGEPIVEHFATHDPMKGGFSLVQLIETSAITAHFVDATGEMYLDIFSCKDIPIDTAIGVVKQYFEPKSIKMHFLTRQA